MRSHLVAFALLPCLYSCTSAFVVSTTTSSGIQTKHASGHGLWRPVSHLRPSSALTMAPKNNDERDEGSSPLTFRGVPLGPILLSIIAVQASFDFVTELPKFLIDGATPDYVGMALDAFFVVYAAQNLLQQTGARQASADMSSSLAGLECRLTLDVGREPGTWMDKDWAASGARLVLPVDVRFSDEELDLGFPGEEGLGGRFCRRLDVLDQGAGCRFVGPEGEVNVNVKGGGWSVLPFPEGKREYGESGSKLRFFLDFPDGASRNDVRLPAGRVFFSGLCFSDKSAAPLDIAASMIEGPGGTGVFNDGGLTIKKNGLVNLYGALGDVNLILGRYSMRSLRQEKLT